MVKRLWTDEETSNIISKFSDGASFKDLQKEYNAHYSTIKKVLTDAGVNTRRKRRWKQEEIDDIVHKFTKESWTKAQIFKFYKTHNREITRILQEHGIDTTYYRARKHNRNLYNDFFRVINTEEKAYILGLLMADGCVRYGKGNHLYLSLEMIDLDIIQKVSKCLNADGTIHYSHRVRDGRSSRATYKVSIYSDELCTDLIKYGVEPNKTTKTDWLTDKVPKHLRRHYLRGLIDGDGSLGYYTNRWFLTLTNNHERFLKDVGTWVYEDLGFKTPKVTDTNTSKCIRYSDSKAKKLIIFLYTDSKISIDRKQQIADQVINNIV